MRVTMTSKHLFVLLLALFAIAWAQNDEELHIPVENDNQFPPDNHPESDGSVIEGSGAGVIDEPLEAVTETKAPAAPAAPLLEDVQLTSLTDNISAAPTEEHSCPKPCVCNIEGDSNKYIVDCSGYELTEVPQPLDPKTTELKLQNNKITEIPKEISDLKNLKTLNAENNEIMKVISGSISELPELVSLKLGNNRLIEYPQDLKNAFGLTKLEELDLGGNDMRTDLKPESFSNFKSLRAITLPAAAANLAEDLCTSLKDSLATVCTGSCDIKPFDCPEAPQPKSTEEGLLDFALPGLIPLASGPEDDVDPTVNSSPDVPTESTPSTQKNEQAPPVANVETTETATLANADTKKAAGDFSLHSAIIKSSEEPKPTDGESSSVATVKAVDEVVGATTSQTKTGGVDKSIIGMVVAGMVLVVAGITIKKNWSSIKNRFSSTPRNANERTGVTVNGTTPEEVPLQEKSPV